MKPHILGHSNHSEAEIVNLHPLGNENMFKGKKLPISEESGLIQILEGKKDDDVPDVCTIHPLALMNIIHLTV